MDPDSLNPDPDTAFQVNQDQDTDPDPIRIHGFDDKKLKKKITYVQATVEAFSPQKRTSSTSKYEILLIFLCFVGHFCPPGSGYRYGFRDPIKSGSRSTA